MAEKNKGGRPTDYKEVYAGQAYKLCLLGATDEELANFFEVTEQTINNWKSKVPKFFESIKKGKLIADSEVANKLFKRATGYEHPDVEIRVIDSKVVEVPLIKHYPPDTAAAIFWLKNRQKKKWREKQEHGFTDGEGNDLEQVTIFKLPDNGRNEDNRTPTGLPA